MYVTHPQNAMQPMAGKLTLGQIAQRKTWANVPDNRRTIAALHIIHVVPSNGSTVTELNPLDPGTLGWQPIPGGGHRLPRNRSIR